MQENCWPKSNSTHPLVLCLLGRTETVRTRWKSQNLATGLKKSNIQLAHPISEALGGNSGHLQEGEKRTKDQR